MQTMVPGGQLRVEWAANAVRHPILEQEAT